MKKENVIEVHNVYKSFKVYMDKGRTMKERILFKNRRKHENRHVLNGISFEVKKGEAIGLIGHNGCGKSTTLKLLTRIMYPDSGSIEMNGRVSSLIELGAGFHPDMSGRENIYINASIFGLTKKEIDDRLDDIIAFSELEEYIENPVRTYSSGMYMRLAFAVAINVDADILLIDEILAVGDTSFQSKCLNKMREIKASGTTIVFVSHSLGQVEQLCDQAIWIHDGDIKEKGRPKEVCLKYLDYMNLERIRKDEEEQARKHNIEGEERSKQQKSSITSKTQKDKTEGFHQSNTVDLEKDENKTREGSVSGNNTKDEGESAETNINRNSLRYGDHRVKIIDVKMINRNGKAGRIFDTEDGCIIQVAYVVNKPVSDANLGIGIFRMDEICCYGTNTIIDHIKPLVLSENGQYACNIKRLGLLPGVYWLNVAIESMTGMPIDFFNHAIRFEVVSNVADVGVSRMEHIWNI